MRSDGAIISWEGWCACAYSLTRGWQLKTLFWNLLLQKRLCLAANSAQNSDKLSKDGDEMGQITTQLEPQLVPLVQPTVPVQRTSLCDTQHDGQTGRRRGIKNLKNIQRGDLLGLGEAGVVRGGKREISARPGGRGVYCGAVKFLCVLLSFASFGPRNGFLGKQRAMPNHLFSPLFHPRRRRTRVNIEFNDL